MTKQGLVVLLTAGLAFGQTTKPAAKAPAKTASAHKSVTTAKTGSAAALPTRATVESFLTRMFGWDSDVKFQVKEIKESADPGIAEVVVHAETPKGSGDSSIFVTRDRRHAIAGQMIPFGGNGAGKPTNDQIDAFMRQMTARNPGLTWTVSEIKPDDLGDLTGVIVLLTNAQGQHGGQKFWVTADDAHAIIGDPGPFGADPFAAARAELAGKTTGPWKGSATPKITMVEFGDFECPACKAAAPTIERLAKEVQGSKLIFQQFPLTSIHHWAFKAAEFGTCVAEQNNDTFWKFMDSVFAAQEDISSHVESADPKKKPDLSYAEQKLTQLATDAGMNGKQIATCADSKATADRVEASMSLGKKMDVTGTPTLFVNGRKVMNITGMPFEKLKAMVEFSGTPQGK